MFCGEISFRQVSQKFLFRQADWFHLVVPRKVNCTFKQSCKNGREHYGSTVSLHRKRIMSLSYPVALNVEGFTANRVFMQVFWTFSMPVMTAGNLLDRAFSHIFEFPRDQSQRQWCHRPNSWRKHWNRSNKSEQGFGHSVGSILQGCQGRAIVGVHFVLWYPSFVKIVTTVFVYIFTSTTDNQPLPKAGKENRAWDVMTPFGFTT
jgi:hypothetical protein